MPVLITGPCSTLGLEVARVLVATGGEVRAFCDRDAFVADLRQLGVFCAVGSLLDEGHLETAMEQVHTVVHLPIGPLAPDAEGMLDEAATVVAAAVGAQVRRIVCLSVPAPSLDASDRMRRAAAEVELLVAEVPSATAVVRPSLVHMRELRAAFERTPLRRETLERLVAPVRTGDLAKLILWLDDRYGIEGAHDVLAADGPEVIPLRAYMRALGITPLSGVGRLIEGLRPPVAPLLSEALAGPWTSTSDIPSGWDISGITPASPLRADG